MDRYIYMLICCFFSPFIFLHHFVFTNIHLFVYLPNPLIHLFINFSIYLSVYIIQRISTRRQIAPQTFLPKSIFPFICFSVRLSNCLSTFVYFSSLLPFPFSFFPSLISWVRWRPPCLPKEVMTALFINIDKEDNVFEELHRENIEKLEDI